MGGFNLATGLGHAAAGFEQARQTDLQRQFQDEQNRRAMASEFIQKIALDPNQSDAIRTAGAKTLLSVAQLSSKTPFDWSKHVGPLLNQMATERGAQQQGQAAGGPPAPPPNIAQAMGQQSPLNRPDLTSQPPAPPAAMSGQGASGQVGGMGMPMQQAGGTAAPAQPAAPSAMPPPPPPEIAQAGGVGTAGHVFANAHDIAENQGYATQQVASGQETGNLQAHKKAVDSFMSDPANEQFIKDNPMVAATMRASSVGATLPFTALTKSLIKGQMTAGEARALGVHVDPSIPDGTFGNYNEMAGGSKWAPTLGKGETVGEGGKTLTATQQAAEKDAVRYGFWQKENNT